MEVTESEFYRLATVILKQSKKIKLASKTPVLLLPSEQQGKWRGEYSAQLLKRIKNGKAKTQYLFSLPYLKSELSRLNEKEKEKILNWWRVLLTYKSLDLRFTEKPFDSCIIGDSQMLVKESGKRFLISTNFSRSAEIERNFSLLFNKSTKSSISYIENL